MRGRGGEAKLDSVERMAYGELWMAVPRPASFDVVSIEPLDGNGVLEINPSIAFPMIDRR